MAERILHSLGILLAGLFETEQRRDPSDPCPAPGPAASEPSAVRDVPKRTESGVRRMQ
ncbi:MAG TPA: hypothetical protein VGI10_08210 [Polyangiaceae bacterium]|jgi:hypothetical protein